MIVGWGKVLLALWRRKSFPRTALLTVWCSRECGTRSWCAEGAVVGDIAVTSGARGEQWDGGGRGRGRGRGGGRGGGIYIYSATNRRETR